MKIRLNILFLILTACNAKSTDQAIENKTTDGSTKEIKFQPRDTIGVHIDTLLINNRQYIQVLKDNRFNCLVSMQGDTIVKPEDYYFEATFLDIDEDGYKDMRVFAFSNTPNQCSNYLFERELKTFKLIENCDLDIKKLKGTPFYYSCNSAGCADMNWESHLGKIENHKLVNYGYINGQGCDFEVKKNPQVIEIYKLSDSGRDGKKLIKSLPYLKHISKNNDKWAFIEKYWKQNVKTFDR
jgi:hypothetical protein